MKNLWGCDEPAQQAVWRDLDGNEYFNCPIRFIHSAILEWYAEYAYYKDFGSVPCAYHDLPAKWLEAYYYYKFCLDHWMEEGKPKSDKTGPLKAGLRSRRG